MADCAVLPLFAIIVLTILPLPSSVLASTPDWQMKTTSPALRSLSTEIEAPTAGEQIVIAVDVHSQIDYNRTIALVVEVRDSDGFTEMLSWQIGQVAGEGAVTVGISWIPQKGDDYVIRTFVLSEALPSPSVLSDTAESKVTIASR